MTPIAQGAVDVASLVGRIRAEFPGLVFTRAVLNDEGEDHAVVLLDDAWVFRFPRTAERQALFGAELKLLEHIGPACEVQVPRYAFVARDVAFGGYRMIDGVALTTPVFAALARPAQERILAQVAALLRVIHSAPPAVIASADGAIARGWAGADFACRYGAATRASIEAVVSPSLLAAIDRFYEAYGRQPRWPGEVVVHDDLSDDHLLLAPGGERLAGVIDFADAALGDPAYDFAFFWAYGDWAARFIAGRYGSADDGILERSRWCFARYCVDQICWAALGHIPAARAPTEEELHSLLGSLS
ncbi:MAG TPA: phosphotransferase [Caulobacteraceae bacterium]